MIAPSRDCRSGRAMWLVHERIEGRSHVIWIGNSWQDCSTHNFQNLRPPTLPSSPRHNSLSPTPPHHFSQLRLPAAHGFCSKIHYLHPTVHYSETEAAIMADVVRHFPFPFFAKLHELRADHLNSGRTPSRAEAPQIRRIQRRHHNRRWRRSCHRER